MTSKPNSPFANFIERTVRGLLLQAEADNDAYLAHECRHYLAGTTCALANIMRILNDRAGSMEWNIAGDVAVNPDVAVHKTGPMLGIFAKKASAVSAAHCKHDADEDAEPTHATLSGPDLIVDYECSQCGTAGSCIYDAEVDACEMRWVRASLLLNRECEHTHVRVTGAYVEDGSVIVDGRCEDCGAVGSAELDLDPDEEGGVEWEQVALPAPQPGVARYTTCAGTVIDVPREGTGATALPVCRDCGRPLDKCVSNVPDTQPNRYALTVAGLLRDFIRRGCTSGDVLPSSTDELAESIHNLWRGVDQVRTDEPLRSYLADLHVEAQSCIRNH
jgi:hypothetical protein